jgi:hypothetical protein
LWTKLRLPFIERERLKAWVIPPHDRSDKQLEQDRKNKKLARKARARREAGAVDRSIGRYMRIIPCLRLSRGSLRESVELHGSGEERR